MTVPVALAAAALLLPGLALELALVPRSPGPLVRGVRAFLLSLALWPVAAQATRLPGLSLGRLAWAGVVAGGGAALALALARRGAARPPAEGRAWWLLGAFAAVAVAHLAPMRSWLVAPGSDMSAHTFLARLVLEADRLPATCGPLYPTVSFGAYAAGLPELAAVLARLGRLPVERAALAAGLLSYPALGGALFLVARRFAPDAPALLAAALAAGGCRIHGVLEWGGNPTVLSLALALAAAAPALAPRAGALRDEGALGTPLLAAGAALVQIIPPLGLAYALPLPALAWGAQRPRAERGRLLVAGLALAAAAAALGGLPYLLAPRAEVSPGELAWTMAWQRDTAHAYQGTWRDFPLTIWPYLRGRFGATGLWLGGLGLLGAALARDRRQLPWAAFAGVTLLLVLDSRYWLLPGSPALYPERTVLLLHAPLAALLASGLGALAERARGAPRPARLGLAALALALVVAGPARWTTARVRAAGRAVMVGEDDLAAMRWMAAHLPEGAVVENEMGDAGPWVPALALRAVLWPHDNPFFRDELAAWRGTVRAGWRFTGERRVYEVRLDTEATLRQPERYREVFRAGRAAVFQIVTP